MSHALFSPSAAHRWLECPGSIVLCNQVPSTSSVYAREGTAAHQVLEWCITEGKPAAAYEGRVIEIEGDRFTVDAEMVDAVQSTIEAAQLASGGAELIPERRLFFGEHLGVTNEEASGTADIFAVSALEPDELQVHDFKYGRGEPVLAEDNPQLMLYALGALAEFGDLLGPFETVRLVIHQPRVRNAPSEWTVSVSDLEQWARDEAARRVKTIKIAQQTYKPEDGHWRDTFLNPGPKQCRWCDAKASCPKLQDTAVEAMTAELPADPSEFDSQATDGLPSGQRIAKLLIVADLVEDWAKALRAEGERMLLAGEELPGWKLVQGRKGNRSWTDEELTIKRLTRGTPLKLKDITKRSLLTPAAIEKLWKQHKLDQDVWSRKTADLISQSEGRLHLAPASDDRPAVDVSSSADDFDDIA